MTTWSVAIMPLPDSPDAPDAWALHGVARIDARTQRDLWGYADLSYPAPVLLGELRSQEHTERIVLVATAHPTPEAPAESDVVGVAQLRLDRQGNTHRAWVSVLVDPDHRRQGVGQALLDAAEAVARERGRTVLQTETEHRGEPAADAPHAMAPPTGSGRIDGASTAAMFARDRGYVLEQGMRYSVLHLPVAAALVDRLHTDALQRAGDEYTVVTWVDRCPDDLVDDLARLVTRMSTDAPNAGLDVVEDPWDAARVRAEEATYAATGRGSVTCAVQHVPTGKLVAYSEIVHSLQDRDFAFQANTLVLREHRGHRLGMLVKAANLRELARLRPELRRIHTWNAEENRHMLSINEALGFRGAGVCALWQKRDVG
ncbi:GNAT family N-acetyltransferase [Sanguibacter suaedae]|uniref:GNAT family N-acetyltransferase n=1 Tax=Sanguibacter suaedae TaxID=2795737 RepID=A0A934I5A3_9MICO|nr:GNAT family N-acetyltransferase [Sanguibacter suaedae]MBI9113432.1 GNAT family N-acetyltransferase [Sanguibacter suaedae]